MATKRQKQHKHLVYTEQGRRWFNKSAGRLSKLHHLFKRELGLPSNNPQIERTLNTMKNKDINTLLKGLPTIYVVNWTEFDDYVQLKRQKAFSNKDAAWDFVISLPEKSYASIVALKLWDTNPNGLKDSLV
jgi:hypothetical protein